jgi:hydrogenase maturation protease
MDERILVMGVGNPLMIDEGAGVRVIEVMMTTLAFPDNVELVDAGTMGMGILNLFAQCDYMLVVDAVDGTGEPAGTVVRMAPEDIAPNQILHSMHDVRIVDVLAAAELMGSRPEVDCIGIQIADMSHIEIGLTPDVEAAIPAAVEAVLSVLAERGVTVTPQHNAPMDARILEAIRMFTPMPDDAGKS